MKYRKKPVVIEAIQWTVNIESEEEISSWSDGQVEPHPTNPNKLLVHTLEGTMTADAWDYIIKGVRGEFYPCKPDIFEMTYEKAE